jgi:NAD(P)-dependent dehydrogenase (short-subunit alcohol dehydrogenase family)
MPEKSCVALITGASQGIGRSIFELFQSRGITTIGISRRITRGEFTRQCDIQEEKQVRDLFGEIIETYQQIDILVNNAGIVTHTDILSTSLDEWEQVMRTNLSGAFLTCKYCLGHMKTRGYGKIVNISSIAGRNRSSMASVAYTCSKYGLIGLTRQLAFHYAKYGININCVCPSQTRTQMLVEKVSEEEIQKLVENIPAGRLAEPIDVAEAVYFLSTDSASYINGAILDVNGAQL